MILSKILIKLSELLLKLYRFLSPVLLRGRKCCIFELSCSRYASAALKKHGFLKGVYLTFLRLLSCQNIIKTPWHDRVLFIDNEEQK